MKHFEALTDKYSREEVGLLVEAFIDDLSFWDVSPSKSKEKKKIIERITSDETTYRADDCRGERFARRGGKDQEADHSQTRSPEPKQEPSNWRTAVDPMSGKMYYYDTITRRTQWEKVRGFLDLLRGLLPKISSDPRFRSPRKSRHLKGIKSVNFDDSKRLSLEKWKPNYWKVWLAVK